MRRLVLAIAAVLTTAAAAIAQPTMTSSILMPNPGVAVTLTVTGTAGQSFAVVGSSTWAGFSYAGVDLGVGPDLQILGTGVLNGAGQGTLSFTPPFPAQDRYYVQAVTSANGFATITHPGGWHHRLPVARRHGLEGGQRVHHQPRRPVRFHPGADRLGDRQHDDHVDSVDGGTDRGHPQRRWRHRVHGPGHPAVTRARDTASVAGHRGRSTSGRRQRASSRLTGMMHASPEAPCA